MNKIFLLFAFINTWSEMRNFIVWCRALFLCLTAWLRSRQLVNLVLCLSFYCSDAIGLKHILGNFFLKENLWSSFNRIFDEVANDSFWVFCDCHDDWIHKWNTLWTSDDCKKSTVLTCLLIYLNTFHRELMFKNFSHEEKCVKMLHAIFQ